MNYMYKIKLTEKIEIGDGLKPFIIAEIGINHNGNLDLALKMIKIAKEIGVDAVKFQVKDVEEAHPKELLDMPYDGENSFGKTYREHKMALEFSQDQLKEIYDYAFKLDIPCFSTPCNVNAVKRLEELSNPFYKVASIFVTDHKILEAICETKKPIIMSTGCSTLNEIDSAVELIRSYGNPFALLHCISCYPTEDKDMNLRVIPTLRERYHCPVGYSGHEKGVGLTVSAVALGACLIERHFTLDRTWYGHDQAASLEPTGLFKLVKDVRIATISLGDGKKRIWESEKPNMKKLRQIFT